jgi:hypothetical protein
VSVLVTWNVAEATPLCANTPKPKIAPRKAMAYLSIGGFCQSNFPAPYARLVAWQHKRKTPAHHFSGFFYASIMSFAELFFRASFP